MAQLLSFPTTTHLAINSKSSDMRDDISELLITLNDSLNAFSRKELIYSISSAKKIHFLMN